MKILLVHTYYAKRGGEDLVFETEAKQLQKKGIEIQTLAFNNQKKRFLSFLLYPFNVFSFFKVLKKIRTFKPDVVHVHNWHFAASPSIFFATKLTAVPVVQTLHNYRLIVPEGVRSHKKDTPLEKADFPSVADARLLKLWIRFVVSFHRCSGAWRMVDRYIVLTQAAKKIFLATHFRRIAERFVVKSNFLDFTPYTDIERKKYFLFVGRLTSDKGIDLILSAFEDLPYEIKIIGDGPLRKQVELASAGRKNIDFLGFKDSKFIREAMSECAAVIFPSVSDEGMPMTILEAFSCATPVITSKFSAMETMIENQQNGLHFAKGNLNDLKAKIMAYHNLSEEEKRRMGNNAYSDYEKNYTPTKNIEQLISIYSEVVRAKSRTRTGFAWIELDQGNHVEGSEQEGIPQEQGTSQMSFSDASRIRSQQMEMTTSDV